MTLSRIATLAAILLLAAIGCAPAVPVSAESSRPSIPGLPQAGAEHAVAPDSAAPGADCGAPRGTRQLVATADIVLLGELHGTRESPQLLHAIACAMAAEHPDGNILVGLELPGAFNPLLEGLDAETAEASVAALRAHPFWAEPGDGRHSQAMLALLEKLVRWSAREPRLQVATIENQNFDDAGARFFAGLMQARNSRAAVVLAGNAHARRQPVPGHGVAPFGQNLAAQAAGRRVLALKIEGGVSEAWLCLNAGDCGPHEIPGRDRGADAFVELRACPRGDCPFDGIVYLPRLTVSMPVSP